MSLSYFVNGKYVLRFIGAKRLLASHTSAYIALLLKQTLADFDISIDQVHSNTTDNAPNMVHVTDVLNLFQSHTIDQFLKVFEGELETSFETQIQPYYLFIEKELKKLTKNGNDSGKSPIIDTHCACHVLELCINDIMKKPSYDMDVLTTARSLITKLRTDNMYALIHLRGLKKPIIDNETRWGSTLEMIQSLLRLKDFVIESSLVNPQFKTEDGFWSHLEKMACVLEHTSIAMKELQRKNLVLSDVYGILLVLKHYLRGKSTEPLATELLERIEEREKVILNSNSMYAAMYLDPRYQCRLNESEKEKAKQYLKLLFDKILEFGSVPSNDTASEPLVTTPATTVADTFDASEECILEQLLREY